MTPMLHGISLEVWSSRFAIRLSEAQPSVEWSIALACARVMHPTLGVLRPEDAVDVFLQVQLQSYEAAGEAANSILNAARHPRR